MTDPDPVRRIRRAESSGPWLHEPRQRKARSFPVLLAFGAAFLICGLVAGYAFGEVPTYAPTEAFINCYSEG